ncbi:hypothetical protein EV363DRAFT_1534015, partial [Boletus edulis]
EAPLDTPRFEQARSLSRPRANFCQVTPFHSIRPSQVSVTFAALVLLQRLKARFPTAWGSSGHRLFISAFMLASCIPPI